MAEVTSWWAWSLTSGPRCSPGPGADSVRADPRRAVRRGLDPGDDGAGSGYVRSGRDGRRPRRTTADSPAAHDLRRSHDGRTSRAIRALWSGFYETTWVDYGLRTYGQYGDPHASRFVRPLAGSATLIAIDELVLVAQNVRDGTAAASVVAVRSRTAGGEAAAACPGSATASTSPLWRPLSPVMRCAGSTGRDLVTGMVATTTRRNGINPPHGGPDRAPPPLLRLPWIPERGATGPRCRSD